MFRKKRRIAVALSGGLDSSVAAALLKKAGWQVLGVHLLLPGARSSPEDLLAVVDKIGLELIELDIQEEFQRLVIDYFVKEYCCGSTPNPCVRCNEQIKFGRLFDFLQELDIDYLATGHYVRLGQLPAGQVGLCCGADPKKDQSYFLHRLNPKILSRLVFPVGGLRKSQVRDLSRELGLEIYLNRPESQEICFIPQGKYSDFFKAHGVKGLNRSGEIVDREGQVLGRHQGLECYTVGQRQGLRLNGPYPHYVLELLPETNRLMVGRRADLFAPGLIAAQLNWLITPPTEPLAARARIRYRHPGIDCQIRPLSENRVEVVFAQPQSAITPGQAVVFYQDDLVLGGGWIVRRTA
jgi:tRNA-specific 2-thiouridylase